jgi:hypothetical protein
VDVPGIDCVLFADPRRSAVDIVQAVGRALRPAPGKKLGYVIVPILHDADATPDDIFESESFQEILTTLRALAANDDRIIEYFRAVSQGRQRTGGGSVEFDMDERLAQRIDLAQFVQEIDLKCWDRLARLSWRPFEDARAYARRLKLKNNTEWLAFSKGNLPRVGRLPSDIPAFPNQTYANAGWNGMGDWLGTGRIADQLKAYRPFPEARAFARKLKLKGQTDWRVFCRGDIPRLGRRPADIPAAPHLTYASKGWKGFGDWLGTGIVAPRYRDYRSFRGARAFARKLKLRSGAEWFAFCKGEMSKLGRLPADIPTCPNKTYAGKGWNGMGDWLGTGNVANSLKKYRVFREAQAFVRKLKLKNNTQWLDFTKGRLPRLGRLPPDIPAYPNQTYADKGWKGLGDWLGTGRIADRLKEYRSFRAARAFARKLKLKSRTEWRALCKGEMPQLGRLPADIPAAPWLTYADKGWKGFGDWLGTSSVAPRFREYRPFLEARAFALGLKLKNTDEWRAFCKGEIQRLGRLPADIPACPNQTYTDKGWKGMGDWLGTARTRRTRRKDK